MWDDKQTIVMLGLPADGQVVQTSKQTDKQAASSFFWPPFLALQHFQFLKGITRRKRGEGEEDDRNATRHA